MHMQLRKLLSYYDINLLLGSKPMQGTAPAVRQADVSRRELGLRVSGDNHLQPASTATGDHLRTKQQQALLHATTTTTTYSVHHIHALTATLSANTHTVCFDQKQESNWWCGRGHWLFVQSYLLIHG
jgi:hypothetical protein